MTNSTPEPEKRPERSEAVNIVFEQIRSLMRLITDADGIEKQQELALSLFKFLGNVKDLEDAAQKLLKLALKKDKKEADDWDDTDDGLDDLYFSVK